MNIPLQISFRNMQPSEELAALVRDKAAKLDKFASRIRSCKVVVGPAGKRRRHGNPYQVHIDLTMPGGEFAVTREPGPAAGNLDVQVAIRDAFDAARRQLEDYEQCRRGD